MLAVLRPFNRLSYNALKPLHITHMRPTLGFGGLSASLRTAPKFTKLEGVQRPATRLGVGLRRFNYDDRFERAGLFPEA